MNAGLGSRKCRELPRHHFSSVLPARVRPPSRLHPPPPAFGSLLPCHEAPGSPRAARPAHQRRSSKPLTRTLGIPRHQGTPATPSMSDSWGSSARIAPTGDSTYIVHKAELQDIWCPLHQASCCLGQARTRSVRRSRSPTLPLSKRALTHTATFRPVYLRVGQQDRGERAAGHLRPGHLR